MSNIISSQRPPRVLFLGMQSDFSRHALRALLESGVEVCAVVVPASQTAAQLGVVRRREQPPGTHEGWGEPGTHKGRHYISDGAHAAAIRQREQPPGRGTRKGHPYVSDDAHTAAIRRREQPPGRGTRKGHPYVSDDAHAAAIRQREQPRTGHSMLPLLNASVLQLAWQRQIPVWEVQRMSHPEVVSVLAAYQADAMCVACFPQRIPRSILDLPSLGCLNVHPSLLPANRGPVPLFWTFREGCEQTGVTIHVMDEALDSGDILAQGSIKVPDGIGYAELESQCAMRGGELLAQTVWDLSRGLAMRVAQDEAQSSYHPFPSTGDFVVHAAEWSARHVYNFICGVGYWGEPITLHVDNKVFRVQAAVSYSHEDIDDSPGAVGLRVRCKVGWVRILLPS